MLELRDRKVQTDELEYLVTLSSRPRLMTHYSNAGYAPCGRLRE